MADTGSLLEIDSGGITNPIETDDPNDTNDTQDTHLPEGMTDIGLREMRNEYLWFNGDIALSMQTRESGNDLNEFDMILNPEKVGCWCHFSPLQSTE